jgi:hypothetical protein
MPEADAAPQSGDASSSDSPNEDASATPRTDASVPAADGGAGDASLGPQIDAATARDDAAVPAEEPVQEPMATLRDANALSLPVEVIGAEYSASLNRVVIIAARPNQLIVLDPETGERRDLTLSALPAALSLHPDGRSAAIAHNQAISIVQLDPLRLVATIPSALDVGSLAFAADGVVYASDRMAGKPMSSIDVEARTETVARMPFGGGRTLRVHPAGDRLYASASGILTRYDLADGKLGESLESPYHYEYPLCGDAWFTRDGERLLTPCGTAFRTSNDHKIDLTYAGRLERGSSVRHMDDSAAARVIATVHYDPTITSSFDVERQTLRLYDDAFLNLRQTLMFPQFEVSSQLYPAVGRHVFFNADGGQLTGWITVDAVEYDAGKLKNLDLRFEQKCEGSMGALRGQIHWVGDDPTLPPGPVTPVASNLWRAPAGATPASGNYVYLLSEPGHYVGGGLGYVYTQADALMKLTVVAGNLTIDVEGEEDWTGNFATMLNVRSLQPGYYGRLRSGPANPARGTLAWRAVKAEAARLATAGS